MADRRKLDSSWLFFGLVCVFGASLILASFTDFVKNREGVVMLGAFSLGIAAGFFIPVRCKILKIILLTIMISAIFTHAEDVVPAIDIVFFSKLSSIANFYFVDTLLLFTVGFFGGEFINPKPQSKHQSF